MAVVAYCASAGVSTVPFMRDWRSAIAGFGAAVDGAAVDGAAVVDAAVVVVEPAVIEVDDEVEFDEDADDADDVVDACRVAAGDAPSSLHAASTAASAAAAPPCSRSRLLNPLG